MAYLLLYNRVLRVVQGATQADASAATTRKGRFGSGKLS